MATFSECQPGGGEEDVQSRGGFLSGGTWASELPPPQDRKPRSMILGDVLKQHCSKVLVTVDDRLLTDF